MRNIITPWLTAVALCALSSYYWPTLPSLTDSVLLVSGLTVMLSVLSVRPKTRLSINRLRVLTAIAHGLAIGMLWMASVGHWYYAWQLPRDKIQQDITLTGTVTDANCHRGKHRYTVFAGFTGFDAIPARRKIRLYERSEHACLRPGDSLTATVRLKPAYGIANPIGFNFQQYLVSQGIVATGTLLERHRLRTSAPSLRQRIQAVINAHPYGNQRWLQVLLTGDKSALDDDDWALLRRTGTGHLFSISGLHLGIVAAAMLPISSAVIMAYIRVFRGTNTRPVLLVTLLFVAGLCYFYVYIAGGALPIVRAWLLLLIGSLVCVSHRHWGQTHVALVMLVACIGLFPLQLLSAGFYLSVGAVATIWFLCWRWQWHSLRWYQLLWRLQFALTALLLPLSVGWFSLVSFSALPINLIVVPAMSVLLPVLLLLLLTALCIPIVSASAMWLANYLVGSMLDLVVTLDTLLPSPISWPVSSDTLVAGFLTLLVFCMPQFRFRRRCIGILLLPLLLTLVPNSSSGWQLHVLDAGQGTAVVISRGQRAVVVDTGASFENAAPTVENALVPLLARYNLTVDYVVISHSDNDHAGGVDALRAYLSRSGQSVQWLQPGQGCQTGHSFRWQGLHIRMLWPPDNAVYTGNNASCVVAIEGDGHSLLLPGDIERSAEYALLAQQSSVKAEVLLAPHHGSATSSTAVFIKRVAPSTVIFTQGFENRWGFPSPSVVGRYRTAGARMIATSETGYVRLTLREGQAIQVESLRHDIKPRWYMQPAKPATMD